MADIGKETEIIEVEPVKTPKPATPKPVKEPVPA